MDPTEGMTEITFTQGSITVEDCVEVAFTQERFDAAVERARAVREDLVLARAHHKTAKQLLDDAEHEASMAKSHLRDLAFGAAGYGLYE